MVIYDDIRGYMVIHSDIREYMVIHGYTYIW